MLDNVRAIYKNGVPHLFTKPLDLSEKEIAAIDARVASENDESTNAEKIKAFDEWMHSLDPDTPNLTDEQISRESIYEEQIQRQL